MERDLEVLHGIPLIQLDRQHWNLVLKAVEGVLIRQHQDLQVLHAVPVMQLEQRQEGLHPISTHQGGVIGILSEISKVSS